MFASVEQRAGSRGAELLDELETILPNIGNFKDDEDFQCAVVTDLLSSYWNVVREGIDAHDPRYRYRLVRNLREMYDKCRAANVSTACGIYIVACHIESSGLGDDDGKFVHSLTTLHVHRARAMLSAKTIEN
jgi:hypothetical protein